MKPLSTSPTARPRASAARFVHCLAGLLLLATTSGCGGPSAYEEQPPARPPLPETTDAQLLRAAGDLPEEKLLNVSIAVFDPGLETRASGPWSGPGEVFPELREAEGRYLAFLLRNTLSRSQQWGAVRLLPSRDPTAELQLTGSILRSDGVILGLSITAVDARGERWLSGDYSAGADAARYARAAEEDPFQPLFNRIANDLVRARDRRDDEALARLAEIATVRYAAGLAPAAFGDYLERDENGRLRALRLPARGDPALERILRIRDSEYLFADTLDTHYGHLFADMRVNYTLWRDYSRQEIEALARYRRDTASRRRDDGSIQAMMRRYGDFRELKLQESALREAAATLGTIIEPTVVAVEGTEVQLEGSLDRRYDQWRDLLRQIQTAETGLPAAD